MTYLFRILLFCIIYIVSGTVHSQELIILKNQLGLEFSTNEIRVLNEKIDTIASLLPVQYKDQFFVYEKGFYSIDRFKNEGIERNWNKVVNDISNTSSNKISLVFGHTKSTRGDRIFVNVELPSDAIFECVSNLKLENIINSLTVEANININTYGYFTGIINALNLFELQLRKIVECGCSGLKNGDCELEPDFRIIDPYLASLGFRKLEIGVENSSCEWANGTNEIFDYFGKGIIINNRSYCLTEQISYGKSIFEEPVKQFEDTTVIISLKGVVRILDNESFGNGEWEESVNVSATYEYTEYWVVLYDNRLEKYYLYSKFILKNFFEEASFFEEEHSEKELTSISPMGAALKVLGNGAIDACMQAVIIRLVDPDVRLETSEIGRWQISFSKVSYIGALWEGLSSLIPWKENLTSTILRTATSAMAVVVDKAVRVPNYTISDGFTDFAIGFGASGLTQIITPRISQFGKFLFSQGLNTWYKTVSSRIVKKIVFYVSTQFDDFINYAVNSQKYIDNTTLIRGIRNIDLMGGRESQMGGNFVNIDIRETILKGIQGDATKLSKFIPINSVNETVINNPYLGGGLVAEDYFREVALIMKSGGRVYLNGTMNNPYFNKIIIEVAEGYGFVVEKFQVTLLDRFDNITFFQSNLTTAIDPSRIRSIVLKKI